MKQFLLALVCLVALHASAFASTQERVINLPQDQGRWYVSLFGDLTDPQFQQLQGWFKTNQGLVKLRDQVHYNEYSTKNLRYQRYAKTLPGLACARVQNSRGLVISEFWAQYIPSTGDDLCKGIGRDVQNRTQCPWLRLAPEPEPTPVPEPDPEPVVDTPPEFEQESEPEPGFPVLLALLSAVIGAAIGVGQGFKEEHIDRPSPTLKKL